LAIVLGIVLIFVAFFALSWRMHTFRITDELVEVRSGILFRTHRKGRLDRIQGINIVRPFVARLFGAARLEINVAGNDAKVRLEYLGSRNADALRLEILQRASGTADRARRDPAHVDASFVEQRVADLTAPELDPSLAAPESVVKMHPLRLIGSTVLSVTTLLLLVAVIGIVTTVVVSGTWYIVFGLVPAVFGLGSFLVNRVVKSLRYTIAATPDGVRVGYGLLSTSNETLPPGRIHSVSISQELLWRPADWWQVKVNRASASSAQGAAGQQNTTILPVGSRADVLRVLALVVPSLDADGELRALVEAGLGPARDGDGFTNSPRRAAVLRWFSWRRNGFAMRPDAVVLRRGAIWRQLIVVPTPRIQSVAVYQGPLLRALRLASATVHTVAGPISARIGALDVRDASGFFTTASATAISAAQADSSHRWRAGEEPR
ncbi:MAG TPA: PH domain-containing protein, partial [Pseudolysinimonas sp.]|nr:PH domain-containing protein [Pseudolysinimonas sp.]